MLSLGFTPEQVLASPREKVAYLDQDGREVNEPLSAACLNTTKVVEAMRTKLADGTLQASEAEPIFACLYAVSWIMAERHEQLSPSLKNFTLEYQRRCASVLKLLLDSGKHLQEEIEKAQQLLQPRLGESQWVVVGKQGEPDHD